MDGRYIGWVQPVVAGRKRPTPVGQDGKKLADSRLSPPPAMGLGAGDQLSIEFFG